MMKNFCTHKKYCNSKRASQILSNIKVTDDAQVAIWPDCFDKQINETEQYINRV